MYYLNFHIVNDSCLVYCNNVTKYVFSIENGYVQWTLDRLYPIENIILKKSPDFEIRLDYYYFPTSFGYFQFDTEIIKLPNAFSPTNQKDNGVIKYICHCDKKYECDIKLSQFVSNEQLLRDNKLDKILND